MPTFTPPTVKQTIDPKDRLFCRYQIDVGQSVVKVGGVFTLMPYPWLGDLQAAGAEGTDWFLGGRTYTITTATADALEAAGYTTDRTSGYGEGGYGQGGYGQ